MNQQDQQFMAQKIRAQYMDKPSSSLEELRTLDKKVKRPALIFAYTFGSLAAIIMGAGMSLVMTDIGAVIGLADALIPGITVGLVGMALALLNYPIYKGILDGRKKKYASKILALSDKIMRA